MGEEWWEVEVAGGRVGVGPAVKVPWVPLPGKRNESSARGDGARESNRVDTVKVCLCACRTITVIPIALYN